MKNICPISKKNIDENIVRGIAFLVLILIPSGYFLSNYIFLFLAFDYLMRIFWPKLSILKHISIIIIHELLNKTPKPIEAAPKRFAAGIGLSFSFLIFLFGEAKILCTYNCLNYDNLVENIRIILIIIFYFALILETFFAYCLGCKTYSLIQYLKSKIKFNKANLYDKDDFSK